MAAQTQPEGTVQLLDEFYDAMMHVVETYGGHVIDIVGDELLAAFGIEDALPDAAWHALKAAVAMQEKFAFLKFQWKQTHLDIGLGIGIHHGEVMLGSVGGTNLKRYTVIGSTVNFAHRLVDIADDGQIMVSPDMYDAVRPMLKGLPVASVAARIKGLESVKRIYRIDVPLPCRQG
jgi:adenylate cyclase